MSSTGFKAFDILKLACLAISVCIVTGQNSGGSCSACNCQFNNVQVLDQYIQNKVQSILDSQNVTTGVTFIRWGRSTCPGTAGTEMLYPGRAGGTFFNIRGGSGERLCLPDNPDYLNGTSSISNTLAGNPRMFGTEYEFFGTSPLASLLNQNVPCAQCYVPTRTATIMIPAKTQCPSGWTREYYGYLTSSHESHYRASYDCLDVNAEAVGSSSGNVNGAVLYYVVSTCVGLDCPPYENDRALSCVVCTK